MNLSNFVLTSPVLRRAVSEYCYLQEKMVEIRALRSDLTEDEILYFAKKRFNSTTFSMASILDHYIFLAKYGESFPEEEKPTKKTPVNRKEQ